MEDIIQDVENGLGYCDTNDFLWYETDCPECKQESCVKFFDFTDKKAQRTECKKQYDMQYLPNHTIKLKRTVA